jgi:hypothetical protein
MVIRGLASLMAISVTAMLAAPAAAQVVPTGAGPIWNNSDAQGKCPAVCARAHMGWQGVWRTPRMSTQSECDCVGSAGGQRPGWEHRGPDWERHGGAYAGGSGNACRAPSVRQCRGCSVTCRTDQTAHCREGDVGIFKGPNDTICSHEARCECR